MYQRHFICLGLMLCGLFIGIARADDFHLNDGSTVSGDVVSGDENGVRFRQGDTYSKPVAWTNFSQEDLKKLAEDPKLQRFKLAQFATPYIEETQEQRRQKTDVGQIKEPPRLKRPAAGSFFGAMISSQVGFFVLLVLYAAGIYAAFEVALFRRRPKGLVCGLAAIPGLGLLSPIIFFSLPEQRMMAEGEESYLPAAAAPAGAPAAAPASPTFTVPGTPAAASRQAAPPEQQEGEHEQEAEPDTHGLKLAQTPAAPSKPALPQPQIFQRGAFMFNRRFFETKFPAFFGVVRPEADKNMILFFKAARGEYVVERISRISANDLYAQVRTAHATEEVMIPFTEIKEVQLKHKDSP